MSLAYWSSSQYLFSPGFRAALMRLKEGKGVMAPRPQESPCCWSKHAVELTGKCPWSTWPINGKNYYSHLRDKHLLVALYDCFCAHGDYHRHNWPQ